MSTSFTKHIFYTLIFFLVLIPMTQAQIYNDHFGKGNQVGVKVSASSNHETNQALNTLSGTGYFPDLEGASRFLAQASLGANYEDIEYVTEIGIEQWIEEQMDMSYTSYFEKFTNLMEEITEIVSAVHPGEDLLRTGQYSSINFYKSIFEDQDVLRNKIAFALLQIFVISKADTPNFEGYGRFSYYDILYEGAFSNYREIMEKVTLHPMMGTMLTYRNNQKADPERGTLPDENYARELMQLFTIGLFELNIDGSYKRDANGDKIPTYKNEDVQELAKVFTGFNYPPNSFDQITPMVMYEHYHDQGEKILLNGSKIPAGQPGMKDMQDALDVLFNHPNIGPFVAIRLIQQMIKSNPSPAYIKRIATVFNNNGQGVRGDMRSIVKAILLDPEARDCSWIEDAENGKLKQPLERVIGLYKAFDIASPSGRLWLSDQYFFEPKIEQAFMAAPSIFNFFSPFYAEDEYVKPNGMVSPEFQILHDVTAINYFNLVEFILKKYPFHNLTRVSPNSASINIDVKDSAVFDFSDEIMILQSDGISSLLDRLDIILCHGQLTEHNKGIIVTALEEFQHMNFRDEDIVKNAIYFIMISADYMILE